MGPHTHIHMGTHLHTTLSAGKFIKGDIVNGMFKGARAGGVGTGAAGGHSINAMFSWVQR